MKNAYCRLTLLTALLALGGCATQDLPVGALPLTAGAPHAVKPLQPLPPPSALEAQYGIQITHIGLTASGGLVDARFKVLDGAKARALLGNPANAPMLITGDTPPLMAPHNALRGAKFGTGQVVYILYPNMRSAIKPGVDVTVVMGEVRLGPVTAQ